MKSVRWIKIKQKKKYDGICDQFNKSIAENKKQEINSSLKNEEWRRKKTLNA